jgi:hypothetical protein
MYFPGTLLETCIPESDTLHKVLLVNWTFMLCKWRHEDGLQGSSGLACPLLRSVRLVTLRLETIQWLLSKKFQIKRVHSVIGSFNLNLYTTHTTDTYLNSVPFEVLYHTYYSYLLEQCAL